MRRDSNGICLRRTRWERIRGVLVKELLLRKTRQTFTDKPDRIIDQPLPPEVRASPQTTTTTRVAQASLQKAPKARGGSRVGLLQAAALPDTRSLGEASLPALKFKLRPRLPAEGSLRPRTHVRARVPFPSALTAALSDAAGRPSCLSGDPWSALNGPLARHTCCHTVYRGLYLRVPRSNTSVRRTLPLTFRLAAANFENESFDQSCHSRRMVSLPISQSRPQPLPWWVG